MDSPERNCSAIEGMLARADGHIHMLGIGGVGMAGLAVLLRHRGFYITGCDGVESTITAWLRAQGIPVCIGHHSSHIDRSLIALIRSMAVPVTTDELVTAHALDIPVYLRGAVLAAISGTGKTVGISGTHGKTTTTSMLAQIFTAIGVPNEFCIGGEVTGLGGVAGGQSGGILVAEADESDGTIALYHPYWSVISNIEFDHMEHFSSCGEVEACFVRLVNQTRRRVIYCADDPIALKIAQPSKKALGYGFSPVASIRISAFSESAQGSEFCISHEDKTRLIHLPVTGCHNALNAVAAYTVAVDAGCEPKQIIQALAAYQPPKRRFEIMRHSPVHVISDYAHHPTEIRAVVGMTKQLDARRVIAIFQPHRYTRTCALGASFPGSFTGVDEVVIVPVYAASEHPVPGGTSQDLFSHFERNDTIKTSLADSLQNAWQYVLGILQEGDVLLLIGAGDIEQIGEWASDYYESV